MSRKRLNHSVRRWAVHESLTGAKQVEVDRFASRVAKATSGEDAIVWVAYPKGTSKNYQCEFNRDTGWGKLGELGFEPVRQVAIDADWTALRFRRVEYIKKMTPEARGAERSRPGQGWDQDIMRTKQRG